MLGRHWGRLVMVLLTAALVFGWLPTAQADQTFHTTQYALSSVVDGSVHGAVIDIHTQGPTNLRAGAICAARRTPGQTYVMNLYAYSDPDCTDLVVPVPGRRR